MPGAGLAPICAPILFNVLCPLSRASRTRPRGARMSMPPYGIKPARRPGRCTAGPHRCDSVLHAVGWTLFSAVLPGVGFIHNRRRRLGIVVLVLALGSAVSVALEAPHNLGAALDLAVDPSRLTRAAV